MPISRNLSWFFLLLIFATLLQTGCVQRRILVRSNPEGALVTIDHQPVGHTPVAVPFTYYGTREIQLEKDGYQTTTVKQRIGAPWFQYPPFDFITDNFWPREIRDDRMVDFQLTPLPTVNENSLVDRAEQLRGNVYRGTVAMPLEPRDTRTADGESVSKASLLQATSDR